jgi:hypothetical protein
LRTSSGEGNSRIGSPRLVYHSARRWRGSPQHVSFSGKQAQELLGQRDLTYREVTSVIRKAIGKPTLTYVQLPPQQIKPALLQSGMSSSMADLLLEMSEALNSGYMAPLEPRSAQNTTPTTIEAFVAEEFVPRFT